MKERQEFHIDELDPENELNIQIAKESGNVAILLDSKPSIPPYFVIIERLAHTLHLNQAL